MVNNADNRELVSIKRYFEKWNKFHQGKRFLPVEEALDAYKKFQIEFPRIISVEHDYPLKVYRARIISNKSSENLSNPKTFSYPPVDKSMHYQRASIPGFPVFYGAMDGKTALEELRTNLNQPLQQGDELYLSEWTVKPGELYSLNYLTLSSIVGDEFLYSDITKNVIREIDRIFQTESPEFKRKQVFLFNEVSKIFLTGNYLQSGIIAHQILYQTKMERLNIDGILYPSCSNDFRSVNIALTPDFADRALELQIVRKLTFEAFTDTGADSTGKYFGKVEKESVRWRTYVSELLINDFTFHLLLIKNWPREKIETSDFIVDGKTSTIRNFCKERVAEIDLSGHKIPQAQEELYHQNGSLVYKQVFSFEEHSCYLKHKNEKNSIKFLTIETPVRTLTKVIPWKKVLKH